MTHFLKRAAKRLLRHYGQRVVQIPRHRASGLDLSDDLKLIVTNPHPVCLDVGANEGEFIDLFLRVLDRPTIHAFEPSTVMLPVLEARRFGETVCLHRYALGSEAATTTLTNYEGTWMNSLLPLDPCEDNPFLAARATTTEAVEVRTIDWFVEHHGVDAIDVLKIDTQGFEFEVLKGAADSLRRGLVQNVIVELMFEPLYVGQPSPLAITAFLESHGFRLVDYYDKYRAAHRLVRCNALFMKSGRARPC